MKIVEMKNIIIGTAGHIDHGKTALVRALTGIDTDRLKEEKQRGISIDLGFAHLQISRERAPRFCRRPRATKGSSKTCWPVWEASILFSLL